MKNISSITRRQFLKRYGLAAGALALSPFFIEKFSASCHAATGRTRVFKVANGDFAQNVVKLLEMMGGIGRFIGPTDVVVIKGNAQWPNQGYTHTGCIKAVADAILQIPGFSGEVLICDNVQVYGTSGQFGFDATLTPTNYRQNNWPDHNWNTLAASYQALGKPVATKKWVNNAVWRAVPSVPYLSAWDPAGGENWTRYVFKYPRTGRVTFISSPVFQSPLTPGRMIDLRKGVWENGNYTGRKVKTIVMPTLNNHGSGTDEDCGITSAIKSFYGATELHGGVGGTLNGYYQMHSSGGDASTGNIDPTAVGEMVATYLQNLFAPVLYITAAMYTGWNSRTGINDAAYTNTVLACENPVTLDYVSSRDVIAPYAPFLGPDQNTHTRQQIVACNKMGIGTIDPLQFEVFSFDFNHPTASRLDVDRKIRDFKAGTATQQDVKDVINLYMLGN